MIKKIETTLAPAAIGPYSQAIDTGSYVFCSGQIPLDPATGQIVGTDIRSQTEQVLKNILALCQELGLNPQSIVKSTVFLTDMSHFSAFNEVYEKFFKDHEVIHFPARSTVAVKELPKKSLVEIEVVLART